jgi:phosphoribosylaminoimidazole-succinocarboxamide synthase
MALAPLVVETDLPGVPLWRRGKVRDVYDLGELLLIVATDRISAFDVVLPGGIPDKGRVLTQLSLFWFGRLAHLAPSHVVSAEASDYPPSLRPHRALLEGRSMLVRKARPLPIECVVRGYITGSGLKDYRATGAICGLPLPEGLREADRLDPAIFTPSTKAEVGHDENIGFAEVERALGPGRAEEVRRVSLDLYEEARGHAAGRGILLADTKFEFGLDGDRLLWIDEALTPDSSRFWPAAGYEPGRLQPSFDKQYVRNYLEGLGWDKKPPAPALPQEVVRRTASTYREAYERLTGRTWGERGEP